MSAKDPTDAAREGGPARCPCGYDLDSPMVVQEPRYSLGGWLLMGLGATPRPRQLISRCSRCKSVLSVTKDPEALRRFV